MNIIHQLPGDECDRLISFFKTLPWKQEKFLGRPTKRKMYWFGTGTNAYEPGKEEYWEADPIEGLLGGLRDEFYPEADSILCYHYQPGTGIAVHTDKGFASRVVILNLIDCDRNLFGEKDATIKFKFGGTNCTLADGDLIEFNSGIEHGVLPVKINRYSVQFRQIMKPSYLPF